jgi:uncharacterized repeat protein (TIGR01451 family)
MAYALARRTLRLLMALVLVVPLFAYLAPATAGAAPPASGYSIDFAAARPDTYDHTVGGGAYNDGGTASVVESLEGGDFSCGELVSYLTRVTRAGGSGTDTVALHYSFGVRATNGANAGHILASSALVNYGVGDSGIVDDGGSTATLTQQIYDDGGTPTTTYPGSADELFVTVVVDDIDPDETIVVRVDVLLGCGTVMKKGNIQANFDSAEVVGGSSINAGAQTIPFKSIQLLVPELPLLTAEKSSSTSEVSTAGQVVPYSYVLTNAGNVTLTGVSLSDDNTDATPVCDWANSSDAATGPESLSVGETVTCSASHAVTQGEMDSLQTLDNTATADSDQTGPVSDSLSIPIVASPSMTVRKSASPASRPAPGGLFTYTVSVENTSSVTIYVSSVSDDRFGPLTEECIGDDDVELAPGESFTCVFDRTVSGSAGTSHTNTVTVEGYDTHETPLSGSDSATVYFTGAPPSSPTVDLSLVKTDVADPVLLGGNITYHVNVSNAGPDAATGVVVTDTLPADTTFVSASATQGTCSETAGTLTCGLGTLGAGATATITVTVTPQKAGIVHNGAVVVGDQTDTNPGNNADDESTEVDDVSPTSVVNTTATVGPTTATASPATETLPFTGPASTETGGIGIALLMLGSLVVLAFRRKDDPVVQNDVTRRLEGYRV